MKKIAWTAMIAVAVLLLIAPATPAHAWHGRRVFLGTGFWWGPPYPYWYYPYPYYPYPYYPYYVYPPGPPVVVREEPPIYIQQQSPQPPPALPPAPAESYWYYCQSAKAYYPSVPQCTEAWIQVPPRAP